MIIIVYAEQNNDTIERRLGTSENSYYFVLKEFLPILKTLGIVVTVRNPESEVDPIFNICEHLGEHCVFLSFTPPHKTQVNLECPTVPVFAWEFYDIPSETWNDDPRNDWRFVLDKLGYAVIHSNFAAEVVRRQMGNDFSIASIPAPVWDRFAAKCTGCSPIPDIFGFELDLDGPVTDSRAFGLRIPDSGVMSEFLSAETTFELNLEELVPFNRKHSGEPSNVRLDGVIYTSILNPDDGRKNWLDIIYAFCWALRDHEDATLVLKFVRSYHPNARTKLINNLSKLSPFKCRVVAFHGFFTDDDDEKLAQGSFYAVNASLGEGQCLPLMEYMSCGKPAIAPCHTGMEDYIDSRNTFLVRSSLEPAAWPHDPRRKFRTMRHRIDIESLADSFKESYRVAKEEPERYKAMSKNATQRLRAHCSHAVVKKKLQSLLSSQDKRRRSASHG